MQNSTEHNPVNKTGNTSLLHQSGHRRDASLNNFDNLSCDDFVETLPKNQYEDIFENSNNLHLFGELALPTPSVPIAMHTSAIMDFSVANLISISLIVRMYDIPQHTSYLIPHT